jgi:hypothetical protein
LSQSDTFWFGLWCLTPLPTVLIYSICILVSFRLTHFPELMGRRGRDIMVVGFAITYATSDYHH